ncbi:replication protein A 70 kDa DNA-binding subunit [Dendroctonus ponderosae]|uniref:replication protein A 70 kDa DNA-binding subunit n=1 Tax=Dendroctonus ponderosae TaxID=77166 RepID=UPI0020362418|nr:replication protein A 70 kDa DNA-binding subunit [Dendroctonus ponderosae]KAH1028515.1 hypothetical protein HUJ05_001868 [Dendroctonus ponderosae]
MASLLTRGALGTIMQGEDITGPVVQVLSVKKINTGSGNPDKDRYRVFLSDGQYTVSAAMMTAPVYAKAGEKGLTKFTIMKIERFITSVINNPDGRDSRVLLILDLLVLKDGDEVNEKFGSPVPYTPDAKSIPRPNGSSASAVSNSTASISNGKDSGPPHKIQKLNPTNGSTTNGNISIAGRITHPISSLSPYQSKWVIKARVINKGEIRKWENAKGSGQLFNFDLADESGEIRCTAFRDLVDKYYDMIQVDKVYYISRCQLKPANKQFNSLKNEYEMAMSNETVIEECLDDDLSKVQTQYDFVEISKIVELEANQTIDVLGVAKSTGELEKFQARSGRELQKKEIQLVDRSNSSVTLTLWGAQAENFDGSGNPVIALKGARISEFGGGKTLSTISGTLLKINPEITECYQLKGWFESDGMNANANDISARGGLGVSFTPPWMSFKQVVDQQLGSSLDKGDYYQVKGTILLLRRENCLYKACPKDGCNKKVVDNDNGTYTCEKCGKSYENFRFRLLCNMNVGDHSGNQWISMFNDECEKVLGLSSQAAGELMEANNDAFTDVIEQAQFQEFILKCRVKMETYNDEHRLKTVAVRVEPVNYEQYNAHLIQSIKKLAGLSR